MVLKLADALSRPFRHCFSSSEHSDAKQVTLPGNRITPVRPRPLLSHFKAPKFPAKHLETGHLDNVRIFTPGTFFKALSPEMQARTSLRQLPSKFYALRTLFTTPEPFRYVQQKEKHPTFLQCFVNNAESPPAPGQVHQLTPPPFRFVW